MGFYDRYILPSVINAACGVRPIARQRDAIAAECSPNIETVIFEDLDLELLKKHRQSGTVLNWRDRRTDLYEVRYHQDVIAPPPTSNDSK